MVNDMVERAAGPLEVLLQAATPEERLAASRRALALVEVDWAPRPVPRCFATLPRGTDDDEDIGWEIAARVMASDDPYSPDAAARVKLSDLLGRQVTVHDLRVHVLSAADLEDDPDRRIGAYLDLAVSVAGLPGQTVASTSSPRIVAPLVYAWAHGDLPLAGTIVAVGAAKGKRSAPIAFVREPPF